VQHLIDTPIQLGQCSQCEAFVFSCQVSGFKVMCNPAPLDGMEEIRAALVNGAQVFRVTYVGKKPNKLSSLRPYQYKFVGIGEVVAVAEHLCPARHKHTAKPDVTPVGPHRGPVPPSAPPEAPRLPSAPAEAHRASQGFQPTPAPSSDPSASPNPVLSATRYPIKHDYLCEASRCTGTCANGCEGHSSTGRAQPVNQRCGIPANVDERHSAPGTPLDHAPHPGRDDGGSYRQGPAQQHAQQPASGHTVSQHPEYGPVRQFAPGSGSAQVSGPIHGSGAAERQGSPLGDVRHSRGGSGSTLRVSRIVRPTRCDICGKLIKADTPDTWAIEYDGRLVADVQSVCLRAINDLIHGYNDEFTYRKKTVVRRFPSLISQLRERALTPYATKGDGSPACNPNKSTSRPPVDQSMLDMVDTFDEEATVLLYWLRQTITVVYPSRTAFRGVESKLDEIAVMCGSSVMTDCVMSDRQMAQAMKTVTSMVRRAREMLGHDKRRVMLANMVCHACGGALSVAPDASTDVECVGHPYSDPQEAQGPCGVVYARHEWLSLMRQDGA
jgi:hypothetical protein